MKNGNILSRVLAATALLAGTAAPLSADILLSEGFEGFTLKTYVSATELNAGVSKGDGTDWTDALPAGWTMTFNSPLGDPIEFQGWRIHDVDSWIATEGNQERQTWTRGGVGARGSVLVADPDAYDDTTNIDTGLFNAFITTPKLSLSTVAPGSVRVGFDSFWRNEVTQIGKLDVSYDGGTTYQNLLTYDSAALADGLVIDEHVDLSVNNPGSGELVFRFGLTDGSNDWWWAVDNVTVSGTVVPEPSTIALGVVGAAALLALRRRAARKG